MGLVRGLSSIKATPEQTLLLKALFSKDPSSVQQISDWFNAVDIQLIDKGSQRLLPLLYHKLSKIDPTSPLLQIPRGTYKKTWLENHLIFYNGLKAIEVLQKEKIPILLLKGSSLVVQYYKDLGLRPMYDLDFLVPLEHAENAVKLLTNAGWHSIEPSLFESPFSDKYSEWHGEGFKNENGKEVDLHWHPLLNCIDPEFSKLFWQQTTPIQFEGINVEVMSPTHELVLICVHGSRWSEIQPTLLFSDALTLLSHSHDQIDWDQILFLSQWKALVLPLLKSLETLKRDFGAPIPMDVIDKLQQIHVPLRLKIKFLHEKTDPSWLVNLLLDCLYSFNRNTRSENILHKLRLFPAFFKKYFNIPKTQHIPMFVLNKLIRRCKGLNSAAVLKKNESIAGGHQK